MPSSLNDNSARLIGISENLLEAQSFIRSVAKSSAPVLITGPTGSGKEVLARSIHRSGPRPQSPFVAVNCAALGEHLVEAELFGSEKGAFTGAVAQRIGRFESCGDGTLFLDGIGDLALPLQAKLLRVIQEQEFYRVGGEKPIPFHGRIIVSTQSDLSELVKTGTFREDLYYRINVFSFKLKPLSERKEDVALLLEYFWNQHAEGNTLDDSITEDLKRRLLDYHYPGNVRELQNIVERLYTLYRRETDIKTKEIFTDTPEPHLCDFQREVDLCDRKGLTRAMEDLESQLVFRAMEMTEHNQVQAAAYLKITRGALQYKLRKYGYVSPLESTRFVEKPQENSSISVVE